METNYNYNEATEPRLSKVNEEKNESPRLWQSVLLGGVPGIMIGAGATAAYESIAANHTEEELVEPTLEESEMQEEAIDVKVATSINDDMSFNKAFASARAEVGAGGAFVWHGKVYGTYRGDDEEWQEMSSEERAEHCRAIISKVHCEPYTPKSEELEDVNNDDNTEESDIDLTVAESEEFEASTANDIPEETESPVIEECFDDFGDQDGSGDIIME